MTPTNQREMESLEIIGNMRVAKEEHLCFRLNKKLLRKLVKLVKIATIFQNHFFFIYSISLSIFVMSFETDVNRIKVTCVIISLPI